MDKGAQQRWKELGKVDQVGADDMGEWMSLGLRYDMGPLSKLIEKILCVLLVAPGQRADEDLGFGSIGEPCVDAGLQEIDVGGVSFHERDHVWKIGKDD